MLAASAVFHDAATALFFCPRSVCLSQSKILVFGAKRVSNWDASIDLARTPLQMLN